MPSPLHASSFQSLLGEKLGAVACRLIEEHYDSIARQQENELHRLRSEIVQLQRNPNEGIAPSEVHKSGPSAASGFKSSSLHCKKLCVVDTPPEPEELPGHEGTKKSSSSLGKKLSFADLPPEPEDEDLPPAAETANLPDDACEEVLQSTPSVKVKRSTNQQITFYCQDYNLRLQHSRENLASSEEAIPETFDVWSIFSQLDPDNLGYLVIESLIESCTEVLNHSINEKMDTMHRYRKAILGLNRTLGVIAQVSSERKNHLTFTAFKVMMLAETEDLDHHLDTDDVTSLLEMRELLVNSAALSKIAKACRVPEDQIYVEKAGMIHMAETYMEPIVAIMILFNALSIGVALDNDPDWNGWFAFEAFFTIFFMVEFAIWFFLRGYLKHFFGEDWAWNLFDFLLVVFACTDTLWTFLQKFTDSSVKSIELKQITVLRLARLVRVTRLIRLIRLQIFSELALMINGVIAGARTLLWAVVLLTFFIYSLGVIMRQLMDPSHTDFDCKGASLVVNEVWDKTGTEESISATCNKGALKMDQYGAELFSSVERSMLTVFNCFTDGCNVPDGTPLIWYLWDTHGPALVMGYVLSYLFICFGVFNLVMAVFVENTLASAHQRRHERQHSSGGAQIASAHKLHHLLTKICRERYENDSAPRTVSSKSNSPFEAVKRKLPFLNQIQPAQTIELDTTHLQLRVTQDMFEYLLQDPSVQTILDDLEISSGSREQLFDILDADGNGYLAVSELVDGILKLRGPADKGDAVSTALMVRCVQKQLRKFEAAVLSNQKGLKTTQERLSDLVQELRDHVFV